MTHYVPCVIAPNDGRYIPTSSSLPFSPQYIDARAASFAPFHTRITRYKVTSRRESRRNSSDALLENHSRASAVYLTTRPQLRILATQRKTAILLALVKSSGERRFGLKFRFITFFPAFYKNVAFHESSDDCQRSIFDLASAS